MRLQTNDTISGTVTCRERLFETDYRFPGRATWQEDLQCSQASAEVGQWSAMGVFAGDEESSGLATCLERLHPHRSGLSESLGAKAVSSEEYNGWCKARLALVSRVSPLEDLLD